MKMPLIALYLQTSGLYLAACFLPFQLLARWRMSVMEEKEDSQFIGTFFIFYGRGTSCTNLAFIRDETRSQISETGFTRSHSPTQPLLMEKVMFVLWPHMKGRLDLTNIFLPACWDTTDPSLDTAGLWGGTHTGTLHTFFPPSALWAGDILHTHTGNRTSF